MQAQTIAIVLAGITALYLFCRWNLKGQSWISRILSIIAAVAIVVVGIFYQRPQKLPTGSSQPATARPKSTNKQPTLIELGPQLPDVIEKEGVVGRRFGSLRVYLAVPPEVTIRADTVTVRAESVPILVVLENDTYSPLRLGKLDWGGINLCRIHVTELRQDNRGETIFAQDVPLPPHADWSSAERRSVEINWPLQGIAPGDYKITAEFPFGDHPILKIRTRLL